ncbi:MAG: FtsK/SpoIIIE domain-containing protein, partial [Bowdeniella nasicola]|nr:FtsK/SpoIIIE domain-containing protein [Bowdeniella nasicola]
LGPAASAQARYLAGWIALSHDVDTVRVSSPWINSSSVEKKAHDQALHVVITAASQARAPRANQVVITFGPPVPWAGVLRAKRGKKLWQASATFTDQVAALLHSEHRATTLPTRVRFDAICDLDSDTLRQRWQLPACWGVPIGRDTGAVVKLDLVTAGPHALVAGMTGAGKSEFLTTYLLGLSAHRSPRQVALILVDFKGGAAFGPLADLPHTVGVLTDLQPGHTRRALTSLRAQLRARETRFAAAGVRDITEFHRTYPGEELPHIVVVIDEFAALADDYPEVLNQLVRLAAQGRSLGLHLIAATQRPAGVVDAKMRANMPLHVCFRVASAADSHDVLTSSAAFELAPIPGRCIVESQGLREVQTAWCGPVANVRAAVAHITAAWQAFDGAHPQQPWTDELPVRIGPECEWWGVADHPETLSHEPYHLPAGAVAVIGGRNSGKTTALRGAARTLRATHEVVMIAHDALVTGALGWIHPRDAHGTRLFLDELNAHCGYAVIVDDVHEWRASCDRAFGPGWTNEAIEMLMRSTSNLVLSADASITSSRWMHSIATRLVLGGLDPSAASLLGVPTDQYQVAAPPGRAWDCAAGVAIQFAAQAPPLPTAEHYRWLSLPPPAPLAAGDFARALPTAAVFTPSPQPVIVCAQHQERAIQVANRLQRAWQAGGTAAAIVAADSLDRHDSGDRNDRAQIIVATAAQLTAAFTGPLAERTSTAALILVNAEHLPRTLRLGAHIPPWVFAPSPAHNTPGDAMWIGDTARAIRVDIASL